MALTGRKFSACFLILLFLIFLLPSSQSTVVEAQETLDEPDPVVEAIFNAFTPTERVGQLFMVSFDGADVSSEADIAQLIQIYRVGGVYISAKNRNFSNAQDTPAQVLNLTNGLQALAQQPPSQAPLTSTLTITQAESTSYTPLPLFIAADHEGDGYPYTQIRNGLIPIPSQMAIGATWDTENARLVGQVVGRELSALGINMLFGPSLDVLDNPRVDRGNSLGTRTFGGHPYWVGQMGEAYIRGVHQGSNNQVLTIAKHFPGFGSSDREIDQGVPTILKPLDELRRVELIPFFQVMQVNPDDPDGTTDGLLTAHIRYQGLQGSVPISLDARNLPTLLALKEIAPWRNAGGLVVSASLGAPAALEGIAASKDIFPARRLAQDAFLAGSDILFLSDFASQNDPEAQVANIKDAITFFQEKYASDPNFQAAVDVRVKRIIKAKLKIYGRELPNDVAQRPEDGLKNIGTTAIDLNKIAQAGATLIAPVLQQGGRSLPPPPRPGENILIFTDNRLGQDCEDCPQFPLVEIDALEQIILQLFGPNATGQVSQEQISSQSFASLKNFLAGQEPDRTEIEALIQDADWIIFDMLNVDTIASPSSDAVTALLRNRPDALRNKNLILFGFNAPYFLGETEISQLTAFYGFYSKTRSYLETAARLLFQQFEPTGASPVSIPAIGPLDLSPDPNQLIELEPVHKINSDGSTTPLEGLGEDALTFDLEVGEGILFRTSVIMDRNGHPVPDGTIVDFFRFYPLEGLSLEPLQSRTGKGIAEIRIIKERDTPLQVRASSNLAVQSETFNIGPGIVDTPTPTATATPTATDTPMPSSTPTETPTPVIIVVTPTPEPTFTPTPLVSLPPPPPSKPVSMVDLLYSLLGVVLIGGIAFTLGNDRFALEDRVRSALVAIAAGLVGYILYTIIAMIITQSGYANDLSGESRWIAPLVSLVFAIAGLLVWYLKPGRVFGRRIKVK